MKRLLLVVFIIALCGNIFPQTWQPMGVPPGSGVTDMVYWKGAGPNYLDKLWVTTSSENWPTGQWGGVYWSDTTPPGQGSWHQVAGGYIARTIEVGQDGNLYASIWQEPAFTDADALCRFVPQVGIFGTLYQASAGDNIFSIAVKDTPHTIFGGTRNGVIRSTDNGTSFGYSNTGIPDSAWVYDIAIDSSGILAIASSKGVFISTDNGNNWLTTTGISPEDTVGTLLFINDTTTAGLSNKTNSIRQNSSGLYAGTGRGNFYKSIAYFTFEELLNIHPGEQIVALLAAALNYANLWMGTRSQLSENVPKINDVGGIYESTDAGTTWQQMNNGLPSNPPVSALAMKVYFPTYAELFVGLFNDTTNGAGIYKLTVTVNVEEVDNQIPLDYKLEKNYPNPFNPSTTIQFAIPKESFTKLEIFNTLGEKVTTLVSETLLAGTYEYEWNAEGLPSGIYFYRLKANHFSEMKKMILLK